MAASVEVLSIDQRGQGQGDAVAQLVLVAQTDLALVVHLGAHARRSVQVVLGADSELGRVRAGRPGQLHTGVQFVVDLLEERASELLAIVAGGREEGINY